MQLKDYYKTLEIAPNATEQEIKKSFRRLALKFHPDKNSEDINSLIKFREIQEAYEILSNTSLREEYNYKRWYTRSLGRQYKNDPTTATAILAECDQLIKYINTLNFFQIDYDGLGYHIRNLLKESNIRLLEQTNIESINKQIITKLLQASRPLPWEYLEPITILLLRLAKGNPEMETFIQRFVEKRRLYFQWNKYRVTVVIIITGILCFLIYKLSS